MAGVGQLRHGPASDSSQTSKNGATSDPRCLHSQQQCTSAHRQWGRFSVSIITNERTNVDVSPRRVWVWRRCRVLDKADRVHAMWQ